MRNRMLTHQPDVLRPRPPSGRMFRLGTLAAGIVALLVGCGTPGVRGVAGTAPAPNVAWTPPRRPAAPPQPTPPPELPADLASRIAQLTLTDVIDIALRNNTATSAAWADARSAAASYGAAKGQYYPTVTGDGTATAIKRIASGGLLAAKQQSFGPTLNVSWLLLDFGGRSGSIGEAREALLAADWTHNATLQTVVLGVQQAYFLYMGTKALLDAQQTTLTEARTNLEAAEQRHQVGLATIADVLQAKTALSQAQLALESTQGDLQTTRGALALSMGLPANVPYDIAVSPDTTAPLGIVESVDTLIARATRERPETSSRGAPKPSRWLSDARRRARGACSTCSRRRPRWPARGPRRSRRASPGTLRSRSSLTTWASSGSTDRARFECKPTPPGPADETHRRRRGSLDRVRPRLLAEAGRGPVARPRDGRARGAAGGTVRDHGHRVGRAAPDRERAVAGDRRPAPSGVPRGRRGRRWPAPIPDRSSPVPGGARPGASHARARPGAGTERGARRAALRRSGEAGLCHQVRLRCETGGRASPARRGPSGLGRGHHCAAQPRVGLDPCADHRADRPAAHA